MNIRFFSLTWVLSINFILQADLSVRAINKSNNYYAAKIESEEFVEIWSIRLSAKSHEICIFTSKQKIKSEQISESSQININIYTYIKDIRIYTPYIF